MLGQPLAWFALIQPERCLDSSPSFMVLTLHHALYDGWSLQLILRYMDAAYRGTQTKTYHFAPFIKFVTTEDTGLLVIGICRSRSPSVPCVTRAGSCE